MEITIKDVEIKELVTHRDDRGFFREIIRVTDPFFERFGQWSHSLMYPGVKKLGHMHYFQTDYWYAIGPLRVFLEDRRPISTQGNKMEFVLTGGYVLKIPPAVMHGCEALAMVHLLYVTTRTYDPQDEIRIEL